ncbi:flavodoxin FldA [Spirochaeta cellobiosiphila]|uniref:flavodoxin FldA n=1 Tax=Spirochaeta cellobiosiphila TaxID=504483 RepID=UPI0004232A47|nr:flavodoxin FldA [Spirochaeta cellobiosiphila]
MAKIGIFYGSTTGNTETVAEKIKELLAEADLQDISDASVKDFLDYDILLLGSSTWGMGDLQDDWEIKINELAKLDLTGKKIAFFGTGDQEGYPDTFVDSLGIIYEAIQSTGASFLGMVGPEGYNFDESKALVDGKFIGLPIDEDNQSDKTQERVEEWVGSLKAQM